MRFLLLPPKNYQICAQVAQYRSVHIFQKVGDQKLSGEEERNSLSRQNLVHPLVKISRSLVVLVSLLFSSFFFQLRELEKFLEKIFTSSERQLCADWCE